MVVDYGTVQVQCKSTSLPSHSIVQYRSNSSYTSTVVAKVLEATVA